MEHGAHGDAAGRVCPVHAAQAAGLVSAVKGSESECLLPPHWSQWKSETPVGHCRLRAGVEASWGRDSGTSCAELRSRRRLRALAAAAIYSWLPL